MPERVSARDEAVRQAVILVFAIIGYGILLVMMEPDKLRTWGMRTADGSRRLLDSTARRLGRASMETELRTGSQEYFLPYHLAKLRDKMKDWYEGMRNSA